MIPAWLLAGLLAVNGADAVSTHVALNRGAREVVLSQNPWLDDAIVASSTTAEVWCFSKLAHEHPKAARVMAITAIAVRAGFVASNIRKGTK